MRLISDPCAYFAMISVISVNDPDVLNNLKDFEDVCLPM